MKLECNTVYSTYPDHVKIEALNAAIMSAKQWRVYGQRGKPSCQYNWFRDMRPADLSYEHYCGVEIEHCFSHG